MVNWSFLVGIQIGKGRLMGAIFLTTPLRMAVTLPLIWAWRPPVRLIIGNVTFYVTIGSTGRAQVWDPLRSGKEVAFVWSIWHKAVDVNEWRARIAPASISKQCVFAFLIPVSQSSTNFGIVFKQEEGKDGPRVLCINFVGLDLVTMIVSIGNKFCSRKWSPRNMVKWLNFGNFLRALHFEPSRLHKVTKCSIKHNGTNLRSSTTF